MQKTNNMKTATKKDLSFEFAKQKGLNINSTWCFKSEEEANEYAKLKIEWWGSNLVYLGCDIIEGFFSPKFNVWD
jgi:hypothetical protein